MNPVTCKVCKHPRVAEIEALVRANKLTIQDASRELGCSYQEAWAHFNRCLAEPANADQFAQDLILLRELVFKLNDRVNDLEDTPTTKISVNMLTSLTREIRGLIRDLGALEGRLQSGTLIQLNQVNVKFEKLTSIMFSSLCDKCRGSLISELEKLEKIDLEQMR